MDNSEKDESKAIGGRARKEALSPEKRKEIAKRAAAARWADVAEGPPVPQATHVGEIKIGDVIIPCAVLSDGTRLLTQAGFLIALGRSPKPKGRSQLAADGLPPFLSTLSLKTLITKEITESTVPVVFRTVTNSKALGYRADLLPKVCNLFLAARAEGLLTTQQKDIAEKCEILVRGLAEVGIVALVDEATGFQRDRAKDALATILEAFIAKELQPWVQTFPTDYYQELFRLRGLDFQRDSVRRPQYFGVLTNDIVYKRLAPGVLDELKRVTPRNDGGRPKAKYFQSLTSNTGYPKLREHLGRVVMMMQLSSDYKDFKEKLERFLPKQTAQIPLAFEQIGVDEEDDGRGI